MRRLAALILCTLSLVPAAQGAPPPEGYGKAEIAIAREYWGTEPTNCVTQSIEFDAAIQPNAGEATIATEPGHCFMRIAPGLGVYTQCRVVIHEYGHWLGLQHSAYKASIMHRAVNAKPFIPACAKLANRQRGKHA